MNNKKIPAIVTKILSVFDEIGHEKVTLESMLLEAYTNGYQTGRTDEEKYQKHIHGTNDFRGRC